MQEKHTLQGHLLGAFSVLVWGTTFVSTKVLLRAFTPLEIMVARFALGFAALLIAGRGLMRPQKKRHEGLFALAGLSGVTLYFLMENIALTYISASLVGVIVAAAPLFTALIAAVVLHEKLTKWFFFGFVCAMAAVFPDGREIVFRESCPGVITRALHGENGFGGNNSMNSFNHYSLGAVGAWM